jgi:hypothetical protein
VAALIEAAHVSTRTFSCISRPRTRPFHNTAVEGAGELPEVARLAQRHKQAFRHRLVATAAEAGATDPESLGRQLAVIFEGANALAASCNDADVFTDARRAAQTPLDVALRTAPGG